MAEAGEVALRVLRRCHGPDMEQRGAKIIESSVDWDGRVMMGKETASQNPILGKIPRHYKYNETNNEMKESPRLSPSFSPFK